MTLTPLAAVAAIAAGLVAAPASALTIIAFEDVGAAQGVSFFSGTVVEDGFTLDFAEMSIANQSDSTPEFEISREAFTSGTLTLSKDGDLFTFSSIDWKSEDPLQRATADVVLEGFLGAASAGSDTFTTGALDYATFAAVALAELHQHDAVGADGVLDLVLACRLLAGDEADPAAVHERRLDPTRDQVRVDVLPGFVLDPAARRDAALDPVLARGLQIGEVRRLEQLVRHVVGEVLQVLRPPVARQGLGLVGVVVLDGAAACAGEGGEGSGENEVGCLHGCR